MAENGEGRPARGGLQNLDQGQDTSTAVDGQGPDDDPWAPATMLEHALAYAGRGWAVFPLRPLSKEPATRHGFKDATTDQDLIRAWWERTPDANIGIATGAASRLVVLDPDDGETGAAILRRLEQELGQLPATYTVTTPGNPDKGKAPGRHLYLWHPGATIKNRAGGTWRPWGKNQEPATGLDVRGDGGYVVGAGSRTSAGEYVAEGLAEPGNAGPAWAELLRTGHVPSQAPTPAQSNGHAPAGDGLLDLAPTRTPFTDAQARELLRAARGKLQVAPEGTRNHELNATAMMYGHFVGRIPSLPRMTKENTAALLQRLGEAVGLTPEETARTVASGLGDGMADPWPVEQAQEPAPARRRRVDLTPYLDGTYTPPTPSVGAWRDDGRQLLYPGRWHTVVALTAAGKSWYAVWHTAAELAAGHTVVYCHFEETSPALTIGRLRALDVADDAIRERFAWLDCSERWEPASFDAELEALDRPPALVVLDGINAACSLHGWDPNLPGGVGAYRLTFEKPATRRNAAVLSLGHPPKSPDRQTERHGFGSTAWLDEVDGVGFRMEAHATSPIRRGHRGSSRLYAVKDRDDQVKQHGTQVKNRDGWSYLGQFVLDNATQGLDPERGLVQVTTAELMAPAAEDAADELDSIGKLAQVVVEYLAQHGRRFESASRLKDGLRAAKLRYNDADLGPALVRLQDEGRLEYPETGKGRSRPGWLTDAATEVPTTE